jgi:hypothetical protein
MSASIYLSIVFIGIIMAYLNIGLQKKIVLRKLSQGNPQKIAVEVFDLSSLINNSIFFSSIVYMLINYLFLFKGGLLMFIWVIASACFTMLTVPVFSISVFRHTRTIPHLEDCTNKFKSTCSEYMKLRTLLEQTNKKSYTEMAKNLWMELTELNKRRHNAIKRIKELKVLEADVLKLLSAYTVNSNTEKSDRSNERLNKIHKEVAKIEDFIEEVENQIISAENLFMDIRTNISVGEPEKITTDLSTLTGKIKSLEYTIDAVEEAEFSDD